MEDDLQAAFSFIQVQKKLETEAQLLVRHKKLTGILSNKKGASSVKEDGQSSLTSEINSAVASEGGDTVEFRDWCINLNRKTKLQGERLSKRR